MTPANQLSERSATLEVVSTERSSAVEYIGSGVLPWYIYAVVFGATSVVVGVLWDISWHRTIGRDTFWTPAHLAIYLGGVLGGLTCGWLVLKTFLFGGATERSASVSCFGFYGPLGAWVSIWGACAMLTSAPFDDWWHNAYGLDVEILSPPHTVLALGMYGLVMGALLLVLRQQNLSTVAKAPGRGLFVYTAGVFLTLLATMLIEYSFPNQMHTGRFYQISCAAFPLILVGVARAARTPLAATGIAFAYLAVSGVMTWVLPLFEARPLLGPIYNPIDRMVPMPFPLLLVFPALALDGLRYWLGTGKGWWRDSLLALLSGVAFFAVLLVVQWNFSKFLLTPAAENWFFAANRWEYSLQTGDWCRQFWDQLNPVRNPPATPKGLAWACLFAVISARCGLSLGNWMAKVRR